MKRSIASFRKSIRIFTVFFSAFMIFDIVISCMAADRQEKRHKNISAQNSIDVFLDKTYPDELLDKIYANKIEIK